MINGVWSWESGVRSLESGVRSRESGVGSLTCEIAVQLAPMKVVGAEIKEFSPLILPSKGD